MYKREETRISHILNANQLPVIGYLLKGNIKGQVNKKQKINSRTPDNVLRLLSIKKK